MKGDKDALEQGNNYNTARHKSNEKDVMTDYQPRLLLGLSLFEFIDSKLISELHLVVNLVPETGKCFSIRLLKTLLSTKRHIILAFSCYAFMLSENILKYLVEYSIPSKSSPNN